MATITWARIRERIYPAAPVHEDSLRRVAVRMTAQTVALLLVMLLALEVIVYVRFDHDLRNSLETSLHQHPPPPPELTHPGEDRFRGHHDVFRGPNQGEISVAWVNPAGHIVGGFGQLGTALLDPAAARASLRSGRPICCYDRTHSGQKYLVLTDPVWDHGRLRGVGQVSISEYQNQNALHQLTQVLLVTTLFGLLASGAISAVLTRRSLQPIRLALQRQRDFVADAAHELRTPLAIMRTVGEVGMVNESAEEQQATIEQMLVENRHLTRLVDDLSLLARADSHAIAIDRALVDLSSLVSDTTAELRPLAEEQGVRLTADMEGNAWVLGDLVRLRQLLLILLDNALKHTPRGGTVDVRVGSRSGRAQLQVADSGPGILPADLPHIFDRFYRADQSRTGEGSGLGLSIGRWIVEAHGGQIRAANSSEHGAVFTVSLPLAR